MWVLLFGGIHAITCTENDGIELIVERCTPTGDFINISFIQFEGCFYGGSGAAIYVYDSSWVTICSCSFRNCSAWTTTISYGGCAYLRDVKSGSSVIDSCATKSGSRWGSFVCLWSDADVALKGLSVFVCSSECGALYECVRVTAAASNLTSLMGEWNSRSGYAAAIWLDGLLEESSTNGSFLLIANCSGGYGCFFKDSWNASSFRRCNFVDNSVDAIAHEPWATSQTIMESCYFANTNLIGWWFLAGSVLVDSCLFAGDVQSTASLILTGVQISFTSTGIKFDTASLLPTCGGVARPMSEPTPDEATKVAQPFSDTNEAKGGLKGRVVAEIVIGALVVVAAVVVVVIVVLKRRAEAGSRTIGLRDRVVDDAVM
jgi:hypothetical protein